MVASKYLDSRKTPPDTVLAGKLEKLPIILL